MSQIAFANGVVTAHSLAARRGAYIRSGHLDPADAASYALTDFQNESPICVSPRMSIDDALTLFDVGRRQWSRVLRGLPDDAFDRQGTHNRTGFVTLGGMVEGYHKHLEHHLFFLRQKCERLGKPPAG